MNTPHIKGQGKHKVGVAIFTDYGPVLTVMTVVGYPTTNEIRNHIEQEQEQELRTKHFPVRGYCQRIERETERIKLVSKHKNTLVNISRHNYGVVNLPDNYNLNK